MSTAVIKAQIESALNIMSANEKHCFVKSFDAKTDASSRYWQGRLSQIRTDIELIKNAVKDV
ncbi:MAG: hypothetical protein ACHQU0_03740 [Candidatus Paceibacteria bacterium]